MKTLLWACLGEYPAIWVEIGGSAFATLVGLLWARTYAPHRGLADKKARIHVGYYPLALLLGAVSGYHSWELGLVAAFAVLVSASDIWYRQIPDGPVVFLVFLGLLLGPFSLDERVLGMIGLSVPIFILFWLGPYVRFRMGGGDPWLAMVVGAWLGPTAGAFVLCLALLGHLMAGMGALGAYVMTALVGALWVGESFFGPLRLDSHVVELLLG